MKKITAFIPSLGGGGAQDVFVTVMNYYSEIGYDIKVIVDDLSNDVNSKALNNKIDIIELKANSAKDALPKMFNYLKNNRTEIAFAFSPECAVNLVLCKKCLKQNYNIIARCINTLSYEYRYAESFFRKHITSILVKHFYKKVDHVIAQSNGMKQDLIDNYGFKENQITTINNPLSKKYENMGKPLKNRKKYILYVGRLEKQKNIAHIIHAFYLMQRKDYNLYIVGNGQRKQELMKLCSDLNILHRVVFIDFTDQIEFYYENATCTVLSSYFEGFPNVLTQSIACGTPVVSYNMPSGAEDIIVNGINGYLVEYLNINKLKQCLNKAIEQKWDYDAVQKTSNKFCGEEVLLKYKTLLNMYNY